MALCRQRGVGRQPVLHHATATPRLDGRYTVFGQVIAGSDVVEKIEMGDIIKRIYVKGEKKP